MGQLSTDILKACPSCSRELRLNERNFDLDSENVDGFANVCRKCRKQEETRKFYEDVDEQLRMLDKSSLMLLQRISDEGVDAGELPHAATLLEDIVHVWGGSRGFAHRLLAEYVAAKPGSAIRQRYNQAIMKMVQFVSEQNYVTPPLDKMTDEELLELHEEQREKLKRKLGIIDGEGHVRSA